MRTRRRGSTELVGLMVGATLFAAVLAAGAVRAAQQADAFGPGMGDIVDFTAGTTIPADRAARIGVAFAGDESGACRLDVTDMAAGGGSLIVESRRAGSYRVHWAGRRTSTGSGDCGGARELVVNRSDLDELAALAGGFGVAGSRMPMPVRSPDAPLP